MTYCRSPSHIWVLRLYGKYSATPCLVRRTRMVDPWEASASMGSSVAKIGDPCGAEFFFQPQRVVHVPAGPLDVLADRGRERRIPFGDGGAQVGHAAVAGNPGGGELLPDAGTGVGVQVDPARFHVPVVAGDAEPFGETFAGQPELLGEGFDGVLGGGGAGPAEERDRYRPWPGAGLVSACPKLRYCRTHLRYSFMTSAC